MGHSEIPLTALQLSSLTFPQIEAFIQKRPTLILPVGSLEPYGDSVALGAVNACCEAIAHELGKRLQVLVAPLLAYGSSTPFKSFGGSAGVHHGTLSHFLFECCNSWIFHGFKRIMIITCSLDGGTSIRRMAKRCESVFDRKDIIAWYSLQDDTQFQTCCAERRGESGIGRCEWGMHALVRYLLPDGFTGSNNNLNAGWRDPAQYKQWSRRGKDPQKLRKIVPTAQFSLISHIPDADDGKVLFDFLMEHLAATYTTFCTETDNAA